VNKLVNADTALWWAWYVVDLLRLVDCLISKSCHCAVICEINEINPLQCKGNYSTTPNNMKLVHCLLMGGLLHLVQRGGEWARPHSSLSIPNLIAIFLRGAPNGGVECRWNRQKSRFRVNIWLHHVL